MSLPKALKEVEVGVVAEVVGKKVGKENMTALNLEAFDGLTSHLSKEESQTVWTQVKELDILHRGLLQPRSI